MTESALPAPTAPVLSTPDTHVFEHGPDGPSIEQSKSSKTSANAIDVVYEIESTARKIIDQGWKRIALQFPDRLLVDAPAVSQALNRCLRDLQPSCSTDCPAQGNDRPSALTNGDSPKFTKRRDAIRQERKVFVLADTSYGACCVDEIAAEHADADVVVHYGRSCLSPTSRLPVIYCFTKPSLDLESVVESFETLYENQKTKVIVMADTPFAHYVPSVTEKLEAAGYSQVFPTSVTHSTASPLPNRTVPEEVRGDPSSLANWSLFHIARPPESLLLVLSSRVQDINVYPTPKQAGNRVNTTQASAAGALRRRYALLTSLSTIGIFGILINTLSVRNYMDILKHVKRVIAAAGKKSYTFVVGKVNAAKMANFAEVGGWVVIGCWESSLFDSKEFWKPIITPFELELALQGGANRLWTGQWISDFQEVLSEAVRGREQASRSQKSNSEQDEDEPVFSTSDADGDWEESEPPEFDLRTGRYVSRSRPMPALASNKGTSSHEIDHRAAEGQAVAARFKSDVAKVGSQISPAADFFQENRSWRGLGSDFKIEYDVSGALKAEEGATMEEGRHGIARSYARESDGSKR